MEQKKPIDLKEVAKRFTEKYYPQWLSRVNRIWEMFEKTDLNSLHPESIKSLYQQGNALGIVGEIEPQFKECMNVISILAYVNQNVKGKDNISEDEIRIQLTSAPEGINISAEQRQRLKITFNEIFFPTVEEVVEAKKEIIFTESELLGLYKKPSSKTYPFVLVENIILKGRIHWLWGFVIFGEWTCGGLLYKLPRDQFFNYKSKTLKDFEKCGLKIAFKRGGDELWIEDYEAAKAKIKCNLFEAIDNYSAAVIEFENGNINKAINKLESAISPPYYSNVKYFNAYHLLIECIFELNFQDISESLLEKIKTFLRWYKAKLEAVIFVIKNVYIKRNMISEFEIENELEEIENEFKVAQKSYNAIIKKVPVTDKERDYDELIELFQRLKEMYEKIIEIDALVEEEIYECTEFKELKDNRLIKRIYKKKAKRLRKLMPYSTDKEGTEDYLLLNIIKKGIDTDKGYDVPSMVKYLSNKLEYEINEMTNPGKRFDKEKTGYDMDKIRISDTGKLTPPKRDLEKK